MSPYTSTVNRRRIHVRVYFLGVKQTKWVKMKDQQENFDKSVHHTTNTTSLNISKQNTGKQRLTFVFTGQRKPMLVQNLIEK